MWNVPTKERLAEIPKLYETEHIALQDKLIHLHFFLGGCDWFIAEHDGGDLFWGFAVLNGDLHMAEWGYISFLNSKPSTSVGLRSIVSCPSTGRFDLQVKSNSSVKLKDGLIQKRR